MKIIKTLGALLLAVYLILVGLIGFGIVSPLLLSISHLLAIGAGVLILLAIWHCSQCSHSSCDKKVE